MFSGPFSSKRSIYQRFSTFLLVSTFLALAALAGFESQAATNQDETGETEAAQQSNIEQITVTGNRPPHLIRAEVRRAERRLYSIYNDYNTIEHFDIDCVRHIPVGSHISEQRCWPVFFQKILEGHHQENNRFDEYGVLTAGDLVRGHREEFEELQANLIRVASENSEVAAALVEFGTLTQELETAVAKCEENEGGFALLSACGQ